MVSEIYRQGSIAVYAAATARFATAGTRHEIEQAAKMAIVAEVFGPLELCHRADGSPFIPGSGASISVSHCQTLVVLAADRLKMLAVAFTGVDHVGLEELKVERK